MRIGYQKNKKYCKKCKCKKRIPLRGKRIKKIGGVGPMIPVPDNAIKQLQEEIKEACPGLIDDKSQVLDWYVYNNDL